MVLGVTKWHNHVYQGVPDGVYDNNNTINSLQASHFVTKFCVLGGFTQVIIKVGKNHTRIEC